MDNYKKAYTFLVSEVDKALRLLYSDSLLDYGEARQILVAAEERCVDIIVDHGDNGTIAQPPA